MNSVEWERDEDVSECRSCTRAFTLVHRKHHCRGCGRIFCGSCCSLSFVTTGSSDAQRVCSLCHLRYVNDGLPADSFVRSGCFSCVRVGSTQTRCIAAVRGFRIWVVEKKSLFSHHVFALASVHIQGSRATLNVRDGGGSIVLDCLNGAELYAAISRIHEAARADTIVAYQAWSDYFDAVPSSALLQELVDLHVKGERTLDLSSLPGAEASSGFALDFRPIARALCHDTWFEALVLDKLSRRDAISEAVKVCQFNTTLRALRMTSCEHNAGIEQLGPLMLSNPGCRINSLDLSGTRLNTSSLAQALQKMGSIKNLLLSNCCISSRELIVLLSAFPPTLVNLDLSKNNFDVDSTNALAAFLKTLSAGSSPLKKLLLRESGLSVCTFFDPKNGAALAALAGLTHFDISGVSMFHFGGPAALQFSLFIAQIRCMRFFALNDTRANAEVVIAPMIALLLSNANVSLDLHLGGVDFGPAGAAAALQRGFGTAGATSIRLLDISRTNCSSKEFVDILISLSDLETIDTLDVSRALRGDSSAADGRAIAETLGALCREKKSLRSLFVVGLGSTVVLPLLERLASNSTLAELDISANNLQDCGSTVLALFLRINTSLVALSHDDNQFQLPAFLAICAAVRSAQRSGLRFLKFPWVDYERMATRQDGVRDRIREALMELCDVVSLRRGPNFHVEERFARYVPQLSPHELELMPLEKAEEATPGGGGVRIDDCMIAYDASKEPLPFPLYDPIPQPNAELFNEEEVMSAIAKHHESKMTRVEISTGLIKGGSMSTINASTDESAQMSFRMWQTLQGIGE